MTLHVLIDSHDYEDEVKRQIKNCAEESGITHPTIEFETTPCGWESTYGG